MNLRVSLLSYIALALFAFGFASCNDDDDDDMMDSQNIVELASSNDDLSILVDALGEANLVA